MKLLITSINAKYVHTNLAVRYLHKTVASSCDAQIKEFSINDSILSTERDIILSKPDAVAFSCYIWNIGFVLELCSDLKKALPNLIIILGGPEVSYDSAELMSKNAFIDYIIIGEGEHTFPLLIDHIQNGSPMPDAVTCRTSDGIKTGTAPVTLPLDDIEFPYDEDITDLNGRIIYYESSRGCPYECKYCLSGERGKVRFKSLDLVKKDLKFFSASGVPLVKFVDRTFNADRKRAEQIWQYIDSLKTSTRFHMEITGELITDDTIEVLKNVNADNLQFEIGVQSTNPKTLEAIDRKCDTERLFSSIRRLLTETDIHIHLDLIAGLPFEDFESFKKSFNDVLSLRPHVLQLGFLKLLKGSKMREEAEAYGFVYRSNPPYEIISNNYITCEQILFLKDVDFVFDKYYNSAAFSKTLDCLFGIYDDKFELFSKLVSYYRENNYINASFSKAKLYDILFDCFSDLGEEFRDNLKYDYIKTLHPGKLPSWCKSDESFRFSDKVYDFLKNEDLKQKLMPKYYGTPAKMIIKHVRFEKFSDKTLMFDYRDDEVYDVTDYFVIE